MPIDLAFPLGLLMEADPVCVSTEELDGSQGAVLRLWQRRGFLGREPAWNRVPSCPYCHEGAPYLLSGRYVCGSCHSAVEQRHLLLWRLNREAFLTWLAQALKIQGGVRQLD